MIKLQSWLFFIGYSKARYESSDRVDRRIMTLVNSIPFQEVADLLHSDVTVIHIDLTLLLVHRSSDWWYVVMVPSTF
jgi:hypothetical protein